MPSLQAILVRLVDKHKGLHIVIPSNDGHLYVIDGITGGLPSHSCCCKPFLLKPDLIDLLLDALRFDWRL